MVYFKDTSSSSGVQHLAILDDENQPIEKGIILAVHTPLVGRYAKPWPKLMNLLYLAEWSWEIPLSKNSKVWALQATHHQLSNEPTPLPTLGHHIIEGKAKWGDAIQFTGEFHYIKGYSEWIEDILSRCEHKLLAARIYDSVYALLFTYDHNSDIIKAFCEAWCPLTNTLLTSLGELSISLWDLHTLTGFPMIRSLYDEVVLSAKELTGVDEAGSRFVPHSCKHLFHAYHLLRGGANGDQSSQVSIDEWVRFWSKKATKRRVVSNTTHNPLGDFDIHEEWCPSEMALFSKLGVKESSRDETYLTAHLAYWLCAFVLPNDDINSIRPNTFKMASIMASGWRVSLDVPILASIYKGLNKVANSPRPSRVYSTFPIHFVYSWLAYYFKTYYHVWQGVRDPKMVIFSGEGGAKYYDSKEACKRIHKGDFVSWTCTIITKSKDFLYVDNGNAEEFEQNYFIAIRSNYLCLRQGEHFIIEPYIPHRFSHQFGFYQVVPGTLTRDIHKASLEEGVHYWHGPLGGNAQNSTHVSITSSSDRCDTQAIEPLEASKRKDTSPHSEESGSSNVDRHWKRLKKNPKSSEARDVDVGDIASNPLETENFLEKELLNIDNGEGSRETLNSTRAKQTPHCVAFLVFEGEKFILNYQNEYLQRLWNDLRERIANTSIDSLSFIKDDIAFVLESMKSFTNFDIYHVEEPLKELFAKATANDEAMSAFSEQASKELLAQQLSEAKECLHEAKTRESKEVNQIQSTKEELERIKKKLDDLKGQKKHLSASFKRQQQLFQKEIIANKNTSPLSDEAVENIKSSMARLEAAKEELKILRPFA
ncbi:hypothetical protein Pfo_010173 [Paulownia fortunei]|nr:hypothetical protein Pfo_010173 [Paulownia fortunei]